MRYNAYNSNQSWNILLHPEVVFWLKSQNDSDFMRIRKALDALHIVGPNLGRPYVDRLKGSKLHNMKELRPNGTNIRLLFVFDPKRSAIVLVAGDKTNNWSAWYKSNIPIAEERYSEHLRELEGDGNG